MSRAYVHHIVEYLEHEKDPLVREPSTVDLSNALKFLDSEGANALRAHGLQLHKATLREGELMYTPPGMWLLDFSDGATRSFFVQASVIKRADAESAVAKSLLSLTNAKNKRLKVMNDDTEILKVTKFHDAMIRSITGQPGHLYAGEALSGLLAAAAAAAPASAVVRFRGCGGVCGCHRTSKSSNGLAGVDDRIFFKNKLRAGCYEHLDDHLALANQASLAMKTRRGRLVAC